MTFNEKINIGIVGAAGYTAGELLRILVNHPFANIVFAQSASHAGEPLWKAHPDLVGDSDVLFCAEPFEGCEPEDVDCVFLCGGHGKSQAALDTFPKGWDGAVIDLGNDFRLKADAGDFVYGLNDVFLDKVKGAKHIANPGCFATAIQLSTVPFAAAGVLPEVHVTAITGSTGAGVKPSDTTHFSWRDNNISVYKAFSHQHLDEIKETLFTLCPSWNGKINFVPVRGDFPRGIFASVYMESSMTEEEAVTLFKDYYKDSAFVNVLDCNPDLKMVVNTNKAVVYVRKYGDKVHVLTCIDNLLKGASGQAVENMNIIFGLDRTCGLRLKASKF